MGGGHFQNVGVDFAITLSQVPYFGKAYNLPYTNNTHLLNGQFQYKTCLCYCSSVGAKKALYYR